MTDVKVLYSKNIIEINLHDSIENFSKYRDFVNTLHEASSNDTVTITINSPGGRVDVGMELVRAIQDCEATTLAHVIYPSASMAAVIACACDGLIMNPNTCLMFHAYSGGIYGKADEVHQSVMSDNVCIKGMLNDLIRPFLTKSEIKNMWDGKDIYVYANDGHHHNGTKTPIRTRVHRHFKYITKQYE